MIYSYQAGQAWLESLGISHDLFLSPWKLWDDKIWRRPPITLCWFWLWLCFELAMSPRKHPLSFRVFIYKNGISVTTDLDNPFSNRMYGKVLKKHKVLYKDRRSIWVCASRFCNCLVSTYLVHHVHPPLLNVLFMFWLLYGSPDFIYLSLFDDFIYPSLFESVKLVYCFWNSLNYFLSQLPKFSFAPDLLCLSIFALGKSFSFPLSSYLFFSPFTEAEF